MAIPIHPIPIIKPQIAIKNHQNNNFNLIFKIVVEMLKIYGFINLF